MPQVIQRQAQIHDLWIWLNGRGFRTQHYRYSNHECTWFIEQFSCTPGYQIPVVSGCVLRWEDAAPPLIANFSVQTTLFPKEQRVAVLWWVPKRDSCTLPGFPNGCPWNVAHVMNHTASFVMENSYKYLFQPGQYQIVYDGILVRLECQMCCSMPTYIITHLEIKESDTGHHHCCRSSISHIAQDSWSCQAMRDMRDVTHDWWTRQGYLFVHQSKASANLRKSSCYIAISCDANSSRTSSQNPMFWSGRFLCQQFVQSLISINQHAQLSKTGTTMPFPFFTVGCPDPQPWYQQDILHVLLALKFRKDDNIKEDLYTCS